jgi:hypothetical protein
MYRYAIASLMVTPLCGYMYSEQPMFFSSIQAIPENIAQYMTGRSWKPECPVPLSDLRYLTVAHWGYDDSIKIGHMVVHAKLAQEIVEIFQELFQAQFPIERMELIDYYDTDDERSMEANNSSAFCCRANTTYPGQFSNHSYGIAIDINPLVNPYVKGSLVLPAGGHAYLDRSLIYKGAIIKSMDNSCYRAFISRGYEWGGDFIGRVDYQHFSKKITDVMD